MKLYFFLLVIMLSSCDGEAQHANHKNKAINQKKVAVEGYDVVAYHLGEAKHGRSQEFVKVDDVFYYFSSEENRKLFEGDPHKYLPKYGGFCAIGVAIYDGKYDIDPEDFLIDDGELYLFCPDQLDNWIADQENLKKLADIEWEKMEAAFKEEDK